MRVMILAVGIFVCDWLLDIDPSWEVSKTDAERYYALRN